MSLTSHKATLPFTSVNNELHINGNSLSNIHKIIGQTPFYLYDRSLITAKVTELKSILPQKIKIHYAIKANPYPPIISHFSSIIDGFDVASKKEMLLALQSGITPNNISFAGPGKSLQDLTSAILAGVILHVESENELSNIIKLGLELGKKPNIALRINPKFELKNSGMKMSGGSKPFGIDEESIPTILEALDFKKLNLVGLHIFAGSQNLNEDAIIETHQETFKLIRNLLQFIPHKLTYINIGGGFGIPYFQNEKSLNINTIAKNLKSLINTHQNELENTEIIMELGRYLVGETGIYVSKVIDIKTSRGEKYIVCDGGLHHHLANSGNFGQVIRKNYPVAIGSQVKDPSKTEQVNIVGPLCTPLDIIANKVELPVVSIGDLIVVFQSGAYGASASPQAFLSQPDLSEYLI